MGGIRRRACLCLLSLLGLVAGTAAVPLASASASPAPVQMTFACALKSNGLMNYVTSTSKCTTNETKVTVVPGPIQVCIHTSNSVYLIPPAKCTAPSVKVTLPKPSGPVFFCAANGSGVLNFTTTQKCTSEQFLVEVLAPAPVLANIETTALQYYAGTPGVPVTSTLTVTSAETTTLAGATVTISSGLVTADDSLGFTNQNGITGTYNASTGVLTLTGTATVAQYQAALRSVTYSDSHALTAPATRVISFQVNDGLSTNNLSNVASRTVDVMTNAAPVAGNVSASTNKLTAIDINVLSSASDVDGDTLTTASVNTTGTKGTVSINSNGTIHYDPNGQFQGLLLGQSATDTFTYKVSDGFQTSNSGTVTVTINGVDDPPVLANIETSALAYTAGTPGVPVTSTVTVSSPDTTTLAGATVTISSGLAASEDSLGFTGQNGITGSYNASTGVLTLTGTASVADYQAALRSVTYSDSNGKTPSTGNRVISFQVDDGLSANNLSNVESRTVTVNPNSPPTAGNVSASTDKNTAIDINVLSSASDPDGDTLSVTGVNTTGTLGSVSINGDGTIHYNPNGQFNGLLAGQTATDTFSYTVSDGFFTASANVTVTINGVNDAPVISNVETGTLQYDAGTPPVQITSTLTVSSPDTTTLAGAVVAIGTGFVSSEDSLGFVGQNGITGSYDSSTGVLTLTGTASVADYQAALQSVTFSDSNGTTPTTGPRSINFQVDDGLSGGNNLSNVASRTVNVNPNTPPTAGNVSTSTDKNTAIDINVLSSASDPDGDVVMVHSVDTTGTIGSVSINPDGTIHYNPNGKFQSLLLGQTATDTFGYTVSDGYFTASATVTVTINGLNDAPVLSNIETGTLQYYAGTAAVQVTSNLMASSPDTGTLVGATVAISSGLASSEDSLGFTNQNGITGSYNSSTGVLTLTGTASAADYQTALQSVTYSDPNGTTPTTGDRTISFQVDDGLSANNLSNVESRTINVNPNSPPTAGNLSSSTDKHTAIDINVLGGASDPDGDVVTLQSVNTTGTLGLVTPNLATGVVNYNPNGQFQGLTNGQTATDTFAYTVSDGFTTATGTVTVTINGISDPPVISNVETTPLSYRSQDPAVAITSALTLSDDDDATIASATVSITTGFLSGADTLQFTSQSGITGSYDASTGVLTLTGNASLADYQTALQSVTFFTSDNSVSPAARTVSFSVTDTVGGTSSPASRTINVAEANQPPVAINHSYTAVGNTPLGVGTTPPGVAAIESGSLLNGDSDPDSGSAISVTSNSTPAHGNVTVNSNGTFTYVPNAGFSGTDNFTYTITDSDDPLNPKSATATVTITVGPVVWYVNNSLTAAGNGEANSPFNTLAAANSAAGANSVIFLYQGSATYTGGVSMKSGEDLFGQPHGLTEDGFALVAAGGSNPAITNSGGDGIDLAENADVEAVTVSGPSGNGIAASGVNAADVGITNGVAISGAGGDGIHVSGGNGTLELGTSVTGSAGHSVSVASHTGGTVEIPGNITDHGTGISLSGNSGATIIFDGVLSISTGASTGFSATGGGTVTANNSGNSITTTTGTALNVSNTTIGAVGLTFQSISSNGANPGINLSSTGSSGGLTVTGTGLAGSGGTIQNSAGEGINLSSTSAPSFTDMIIEHNGSGTGDTGDGINGSQVNGLTVAGSTVSGNGNPATQSGENDDGMDFSPGGGTGSPNGLTGTVSITNSTITGSADNNVIISDTSGTLNLTVTGSTISENSTSTGNDGIHVDANDTASATVSITGSTFTNNQGDHFQFSTNATSSGTNSVTFSSNTLSSPNPDGATVLGGGVVISPGGGSHNTITIDSNNIQVNPATSYNGIAIDTNNTATVSGHVNGNTVGTATVSDSGSGNGIGIFAEDSATETLAITNNNLFQYRNFAGIYYIDRQGNPTMNLTITGNKIADPGGTFGAWGILGDAGALSTDNGKVCADISSNSLTGSGQPALGTFDVELDQAGDTTYELPGYTGTQYDTGAVGTFVAANNSDSAANVLATTNMTGPGFVGGASCPAPA